MKYIIASAVVLLLIGAPLGSYFYLKSGFVYRLNSLEELQQKNIDNDLNHLLDSIVPDNNKVSLVYLQRAGDNLANDQLAAIEEQIVDRTNFQTIRVDAADTRLLNQVDQSVSFYLLDTAGVVRNYYESDDETLKRIIRHLSVVIPMPKRRNVRLQRDVENDK